jgi:hypothetical protein
MATNLLKSAQSWPYFSIRIYAIHLHTYTHTQVRRVVVSAVRCPASLALENRDPRRFPYTLIIWYFILLHSFNPYSYTFSYTLIIHTLTHTLTLFRDPRSAKHHLQTDAELMQYIDSIGGETSHCWYTYIHIYTVDTHIYTYIYSWYTYIYIYIQFI